MQNFRVVIAGTRRPWALGLAGDVGVFVAGAALQFLVVYGVVPWASRAWRVDSLAAWMLLSVPLIFAPIAVGGLLLACSESRPVSWRDRLRLRRPSRRDWLWGVAALVVLGAASGAAFAVCAAVGLPSHPPFARGVPALTADRAWMVAVWLVYWPVNMLGEEFVWRGVILPRMAERVGRWAWLLNAAVWGVFHLAFGPGNLIVLLPTLILVPLIAQLRRNTWLAVLLHAGLSGPGFVALALGFA